MVLVIFQTPIKLEGLGFAVARQVHLVTRSAKARWRAAHSEHTPTFRTKSRPRHKAMKLGNAATGEEEHSTTQPDKAYLRKLNVENPQAVGR